jgi:hypothetical protein
MVVEQDGLVLLALHLAVHDGMALGRQNPGGDPVALQEIPKVLGALLHPNVLRG